MYRFSESDTYILVYRLSIRQVVSDTNILLPDTRPILITYVSVLYPLDGVG